MTAIYSDVK